MSNVFDELRHNIKNSVFINVILIIQFNSVFLAEYHDSELFSGYASGRNFRKYTG